MLLDETKSFSCPNSSPITDYLQMDFLKAIAPEGFRRVVEKSAISLRVTRKGAIATGT
ncbi:hypothetical protein [Nostoc sp.]|uniref:hypothetical protein n=1 Tax=Nostoc sp. TaxID=1180 RepID=UPI002FFAAAE1